MLLAKQCFPVRCYSISKRHQHLRVPVHHYTINSSLWFVKNISSEWKIWHWAYRMHHTVLTYQIRFAIKECIEGQNCHLHEDRKYLSSLFHIWPPKTAQVEIMTRIEKKVDWAQDDRRICSIHQQHVPKTYSSQPWSSLWQSMNEPFSITELYYTTSKQETTAEKLVLCFQCITKCQLFHPGSSLWSLEHDQLDVRFGSYNLNVCCSKCRSANLPSPIFCYSLQVKSLFARSSTKVLR